MASAEGLTRAISDLFTRGRSRGEKQSSEAGAVKVETRPAPEIARKKMELKSATERRSIRRRDCRNCQPLGEGITRKNNFWKSTRTTEREREAFTTSTIAVSHLNERWWFGCQEDGDGSAVNGSPSNETLEDPLLQGVCVLPGAPFN